MYNHHHPHMLTNARVLKILDKVQYVFPPLIDLIRSKISSGPTIDKVLLANVAFILSVFCHEDEPEIIEELMDDPRVTAGNINEFSSLFFTSLEPRTSGYFLPRFCLTAQRMNFEVVFWKTLPSNIFKMRDDIDVFQALIECCLMFKCIDPKNKKDVVLEVLDKVAFRSKSFTQKIIANIITQLWKSDTNINEEAMWYLLDNKRFTSEWIATLAVTAHSLYLYSYADRLLKDPRHTPESRADMYADLSLCVNQYVY